MSDNRQVALDLVSEGQALVSDALCAGREGGRAKLLSSYEKFTKALELEPALIEARAHRSNVSQILQNPRAAALDAIEVWKAKPSDPSICLEIASGLPIRERVEALRQGLAKTEQNHPIFFALWLNLADAFWQAGDYAESAAQHQAMIQRRVETKSRLGLDSNWFALGLCQELLEQHVEAETSYRTSLEVSIAESKATEAVWTKIAVAIIRCHLHRNDYGGALRVIYEFSRYLSSLEGRSWHALVLWLLGEPYTGLVSPDEFDTPTGQLVFPFLVGSLSVMTGRLQEGKIILERFIRSCDDHPAVWGVTCRWEVCLARSIVNPAKP